MVKKKGKEMMIRNRWWFYKFWTRFGHASILLFHVLLQVLLMIPLFIFAAIGGIIMVIESLPGWIFDRCHWFIDRIVETGKRLKVNTDRRVQILIKLKQEGIENEHKNRN